jgi:hypothetical protein
VSKKSRVWNVCDEREGGVAKLLLADNLLAACADDGGAGQAPDGKYLFLTGMSLDQPLKMRLPERMVVPVTVPRNEQHAVDDCRIDAAAAVDHIQRHAGTTG